MTHPSNPETEHLKQYLGGVTRRHFLRDCPTGLGAMWLASRMSLCPSNSVASSSSEGAVSLPHFRPSAKRVIYLHMTGAPSQLELFDYKPMLAKYDGKDCPQDYLEGQRFAFIQGTPQLLGPQYPFQRHGESGAWISDRFPLISQHADELSFIKTMQTDQFNHAPAQLLVHSGSARSGNPSIGAWTTWGLGSENDDLPGFIVLLSGGMPRFGGALWGSGFLPSVFQGVNCRSKGDPILNISSPKHVSREVRRDMLDALADFGESSYKDFGDPETVTRIAQYEMSFKMQIATPKVADISQESQKTLELYGAVPGEESFANNCLLARRFAEAGVRYIQLFDEGWDSHGVDKKTALEVGFKEKCEFVDRPIAALLTDLKQRGMLEETLVVWGGEFGRTPMRENRGGNNMAFVGRDHAPAAFTIWMAGGGIKPGVTYGETDDFGYRPAVNPTNVRDLHATMLRLMGIDHQRFVYPFQGLNQRLTGVQHAQVIEELIA
jgi:hypothetical protein